MVLERLLKGEDIKKILETNKYSSEYIEYIGNYHKSKDMKILKIDGNWITFMYQRIYWVSAKVFEEPSDGINEGRIIKMSIKIRHERGKWIYHYDREPDFDETPLGLLDGILKIFEDYM